MTDMDPSRRTGRDVVVALSAVICCVIIGAALDAAGVGVPIWVGLLLGIVVVGVAIAAGHRLGDKAGNQDRQRARRPTR